MRNLAKVQDLVKQGADVNAKTTDGATTPLHIASENGQGAMFEALLPNGADVKLQDSKGNTPADYAKQKGHEEVVRFLTAPPEKQ